MSFRRWSYGLLATTMFTAVGAPALAQQATQLEELVITAQKREENLQDVPISVQALGTQRLEELQVSDFADFARFLPSVSFRTGGPGFTAIYMRGVASGENSNHSGPLPSVGVYLDEQPVTTITGPLDVHVYDMARIEALSGPQGTLYGASSQAGTIRYITNKPDPTGRSWSYDVELNRFTDGGTGYALETYLNQPLSDRAAFRIVAWYQKDGGYIDNVRGTRTFPTSGITINNNALAEDDFNDVETYGARAALRVDLNENWTVTPSVMAQDATTDGLFAFDPDNGDLQVTHFYPDTARDQWLQAALTIEGKIADLDVVYAGAHLERAIHGMSDYSDYSFFYDTLFGYGAYLVDDAGNLIHGAQYIQSKDIFKKDSHELRLSTPADNRLRMVGGVFFQKQTHNIQQRYRIDQLASDLEVPNWPDTLWLTKQLREDKDYAIFGEAAFDFTEQLTLTGGLRLFKAENSLKGFFGFGAGFSSGTGEAACFGPAVVDGAPCTNLNKTTKDDGYTYRVNLSYEIDADKMVYATWSNGYRPGGINRRGTLPPYSSDYLTNYEAGWKTVLLDGSLRWNGAVFYDKWKDFQFSFLGANGLTEIRNAAQAVMKGVETDFQWRTTDALTLSGAASYIDAKLDAPYCNSGGTTCADPGAPEGQQLPVTPKFKANLTARYEWSFGDADAHVQGSIVHEGSKWTDLRSDEREITGKLPSWTTFDLSAGLDWGDTHIIAYIKNLTDERGEISRFAQCATSVCGEQTYSVPIKPRIIGIKFGQSF